MNNSVKIILIAILAYFLSACSTHKPNYNDGSSNQFNPYAPSKYPKPKLNQNVW